MPLFFFFFEECPQLFCSNNQNESISTKPIQLFINLKYKFQNIPGKRDVQTRNGSSWAPGGAAAFPYLIRPDGVNTHHYLKNNL